MMRYYRLTIVLLVLGFAVGTLINPIPAMGASAAEINRDAKSALESLYAKSSATVSDSLRGTKDSRVVPA